MVMRLCFVFVFFVCMAVVHQERGDGDVGGFRLRILSYHWFFQSMAASRIESTDRRYFFASLL